MALITKDDISELQSKVIDLKEVKSNRETEKKESEASNGTTFEEITLKTADLKKVKSDIELNTKLQEDFGKLVDEKGALLDTTINSEKANSASREALQVKLDTSFKEQDTKTFDKKEREAKKADLEMSLTNLNSDIAKMQTEYDGMANGPEKDALLLKIQDAQAKANDISNSIAAETTAIAALQAELDALSTSIEADNAAMKALETEHKAISELLAKTETELVDAKVGRKAAIDDGAAMATEKQSIEDNLTELNQDYNKAKAHIKALTSEISAIEQEIKNIEESDLIKEFEEQENNRKNLVRNTFTNKSRVAPLIKDTNEGLDKVVSDFTDDTNLFVEDIKQEIGFNDQADNVLQDVIENFKNDGILTARQALNLARESLFNIKLNNIESKIKAACEKGFTSVRLTSKQISATQVVALNSLGYKISHYAIPQPGDTPDLMGIIVEWGIIDK